jgi:hypothetical protein
MCTDTFTSIGSTALLILNRLNCQERLRELVNSNEKKDERSATDHDGGERDEQQ